MLSSGAKNINNCMMLNNLGHLCIQYYMTVIFVPRMKSYKFDCLIRLNAFFLCISLRLVNVKMVNYTSREQLLEKYSRVAV